MGPGAIRELRYRLRESQAQFAKRFNVTQVTVANWESERTQPGRRSLKELLAVGARTVPVRSTITPFRPIQYLGSKQRLAATIASVIEEVAPGKGRVGDLFAGSGVVSELLGKNRPVTAVDVQAFSQALTTVLLQSKAESYYALIGPKFLESVEDFTRRIASQLVPLLDFETEALLSAAEGDPSNLNQIIEYGSLAVHIQRPMKQCPRPLAGLLGNAAESLNAIGIAAGDLTATRYFGGPYFSYAQSVALDATYLAAKELADPLATRCALAVLLSSASEVVNTVGKQFAQPMKLRKADGRIPPILLQRTLRDRTLDPIRTFQDWAVRWQERAVSSIYEHHVERRDVIDFLYRDQDCVAYYADPPYTIDHYSRFYHVLETLVLRDSPRLDEMRKRDEVSVMRGIYRTGRHQSSFCVPSLAPTAFEELFARAAQRGVPFVLSYSPFDEQEGHRPRLLPLLDLETKARRYYRRVSVMEITAHSHRKLNSKARNTAIPKDAERLIICEV